MKEFADRRSAGRALARSLSRFRGIANVVVLALPRGGVPVGYEVALALHAPFDAFAVRKLGVPGHAELAMGAVASGGIVVADETLLARAGIPRAAFDAVVSAEVAELERREAAYRNHRVSPQLEGKTVIVVNDGLATGASMRAAIAALRRRHPAAIVAAVPVGSRESCRRLEGVADDVVCAVVPHPFYAVGEHYDDFRQTTDDEVRRLLDAADRERAAWRVA